jgi:outer membrane receptor for ferrienterochelin and colicins
MDSRRFVMVAVALLFLSGSATALAEQTPAAATDTENKSFEAMFGKGPQEEDVYRNDRLLITATGSQKPVHLAPSVATVITAEDIKDMGATTLDEALETVPGFHVEPSGTAYLSSIWSIRGIHTATNPQVLLLIDGVPFTSNYQGSRPIGFKMPVAMISRIEVVLGPGSALYGADAFSGVVNVITKDNFEINGSQAGVRYGSFDTVDTWVQQGGQYGGWDLALGVEWQKTAGDHDRIVERDALGSGLPSRTPAPLNTDYNILDTHLNLRRADWTLHLYGQLHNGGDSGPGLAQIITTGNELDDFYLLSDLSYTNDHSLENWTLGARLYGSYMKADNSLVILPANVAPPQGEIGNPITDSRDGGLEASAVYKGWNDHQLRLGTGYKNYNFEPDQYKNFNLPVAGGYKQCVPAADVFGQPTHITDPDCLYMPSANRHLVYGLAQDEWQFARTWALTAGARYDEYSDFGSTINPRAALVWETLYNLTTKLMYGTAFRAPSFSELYASKNPQSIGNPDLKPEKIENEELAFDYQPTKNLRLILSLFTYEATDLIDLIGPLPQVYANNGSVRGNGFEVDSDWLIVPSLRLKANFSYQRAINTTADALVTDAPAMQLTLNPRWEFLPDWSLDGLLNWVADRPRAEGDPRDDIANYTLVNLTLRRTNIAKHWEAAVSVRNLFDENASIPSPYAPGNQFGAAIPNDYPMEGRSVWGEVSCHF